MGKNPFKTVDRLFTSLLIFVRLVRRFTNSVRFLSVVASYVLTRTRKVEKQLSNCGGSHRFSQFVMRNSPLVPSVLSTSLRCYRTATPTINVGLEPSGSRLASRLRTHVTSLVSRA